ncbi:MAG TPA: FCD domain-containing protein [Acidobacteriaceae bacterium]|nr:FCD domain-containing protein [Acidobacteriaceae bacterium]
MVSTIWQPGDDGRSRCTTRVIEYVWNRVREGSLRTGDRLPSEREVAEQLRVSRSTIRAGIAYLSGLGIVDVRPGQGVYISDTPAAFPLPGVDLLCGLTTEALVEARLLVENAIAGLAAVRASENDCAVLAETVAEMYAASDDLAAFRVHDVRFHRAMARACGNSILAAMAETLLARISADLPAAFEERGDLRRTAELHHATYRAVRLGDSAGAVGPLLSCIRLWVGDGAGSWHMQLD